MKYNVCIIKPEGYIHSGAFMELAELVLYGLMDLGHETFISANQIYSDSRNIIFGCHLMDTSLIKDLPKSTIIINTEQIYSDQTDWHNKIFLWTRNFETWDYSERNLLKLNEIGAMKPKLLRIGFHPKLARIQKSNEQDIDVLFYGSIGERRRKVLNLLESSGCKVEAVFGVYGEERDKLISRSKVVLNMHYYSSKIFEIVRVFYLMTNSKAVVSEISDTTAIDSAYLDGVFPADYDDIVEACKQLTQDDKLRNEVEMKAFSTISKLPQSDLLAPLLD